MVKGARESGTERGSTRVAGKPASPTLEDLGVDKNLANQARKLAELSEAELKNGRLKRPF
jgi:hypothetical protein